MKKILDAPSRADWRYGAFHLVHVTGFVASTLLMSWGLFVLFFLALGGFSVDGLMHHLNNLTSRYVAAAPERAAAFGALLYAAQLLLTLALIVIRRHRILPSRVALGRTLHV